VGTVLVEERRLHFRWDGITHEWINAGPAFDGHCPLFTVPTPCPSAATAGPAPLGLLTPVLNLHIRTVVE
jgi:hypothetical protein